MEFASYDDLIENIRFFMGRNRRGFKQRAVAELCGFGEKEFSNILHGRKKIGAQDIPRIAGVLNVTPNDLFYKRNLPTNRPA